MTSEFKHSTTSLKFSQDELEDLAARARQAALNKGATDVVAPVSERQSFSVSVRNAQPVVIEQSSVAELQVTFLKTIAVAMRLQAC